MTDKMTDKEKVDIMAKINETHETITRIFNRFDNLKDKLDPVLSPASPAEEEKTANVSGGSPLLKEIIHLIQCLDNLDSKITKTYSRIELNEIELTRVIEDQIVALFEQFDYLKKKLEPVLTDNIEISAHVNPPVHYAEHSDSYNKLANIREKLLLLNQLMGGVVGMLDLPMPDETGRGI